MTVVTWQREGGAHELKLLSFWSLENGTMYFNISIFMYILFFNDSNWINMTHDHTLGSYDEI